jgi:hypothetical protein
MCGIAGYIGQSNDLNITYNLITKLFEKIEIRGIDASGYWGAEPGAKGKVYYHKEPIKSSLFIKNYYWKSVMFNANLNILLVHSRGASKGVGEPSENYNNHPFTNCNKSIGLIHNGRIDDVEYNAFKQKYEIKTKCDSEILLRIFESGEMYDEEDLNHLRDIDHPQRIAGISDIFSLINEGHMAVAIGERGSGNNRMLWLFRNYHRPLWIVDLRDILGQIFFVSEPSIWESAINECYDLKSIFKNQRLYELPTEEIWYLNVNQENLIPNVERYQVFKNDLKPWVFDGKRVYLKEKESNFEVISGLDDNDFLDNDYYLDDFHQACDDIIDSINNIRNVNELSFQNNFMSYNELYELTENLEKQKNILDRFY